MKNRMSVLTILAATFIFSAVLHGQPADIPTQLDQIRELLKPGETDSPEVKNVKAMLQRYPDTWQSLLDRDQLGGFSEYGTKNLGAELSSVPDLAAKIDAFTKSVKEESERRDNAKIAAAEALIAQVGNQLQSAKKAEDLDALLLSLGKYKDSGYGNNPKLSALYRDMQGALQIAGNWQEYLIAEETGNAQESRSNLQQVSSQLSSTPIFPRSIVLRLLNPSTPKSADAKEGETAEPRVSLDAIMAKLTESGDSATALAELKSIPKAQLSGSDESYFPRYVQAVEDLRKLEPAMAESEVFANIRTTAQNSQSQGRYSLTRAIDQIALNAIARSYGIATPSTTATSARKVMESIAAGAREQQDWPKLRKAINSIENLNAGAYGQDVQKRTSDLKIISLLELGKAAEQRDDFEAAATAYLEASAIDGQYLQRELAYGRLADLKQKSPDKVGSVMAKAEENRQRAEAARYAAEIEGRDRRMMNPGMPHDRMRPQDLTMMRPMIQEAVAEFLREKRLEAAKPAENVAKPEKTPKAE